MAKYDVTVKRLVVQTAVVDNVEATNRADAIEIAKMRSDTWWDDYSHNEDVGNIQVVSCVETQSNREQAKELREYAKEHSGAFPEESAALEAEADRLEKL